MQISRHRKATKNIEYQQLIVQRKIKRRESLDLSLQQANLLTAIQAGIQKQRVEPAPRL